MPHGQQGLGLQRATVHPVQGIVLYTDILMKWLQARQWPCQAIYASSGGPAGRR